jgi:hypothetical protein
MLKKFLDTPITWRQSLIMSGISTAAVLVWYGALWLDYEYDIVDNTKEFVGNRINDVKHLLKKGKC